MTTASRNDSAPRADARSYRFTFADQGKPSRTLTGTLKLEGSWAMVYVPGVGTIFSVPADSVDEISMVGEVDDDL